MCIRDRTRRTAYCDKGYRTGRATHSVCSGKWCFEITVDNPRELKHARDPGTPTEPHIRVGWCSSKFRLEAPVGFDRHGFSYRDMSQRALGAIEGGGSVFHRARGRAYGASFGVGDSISCYICMPAEDQAARVEVGSVSSASLPHPHGPSAECTDPTMTKEEAALQVHRGSYIAFVKNGVYQGKAFVDIPQGNYYPCVALYMGASVTFNFGDPVHGGFKFHPPEQLQGFNKMAQVSPIVLPDSHPAPMPGLEANTAPAPTTADPTAADPTAAEPTAAAPDPSAAPPETSTAAATPADATAAADPDFAAAAPDADQPEPMATDPEPSPAAAPEDQTPAPPEQPQEHPADE
eukprot:TRINITY_DN22229_c0_g1_i1.p1 TRINITY_DN22229_c0_g1~~TRINITY_DN22229_c0_g1_i1.p1  ORF type:complete len:349 (-),score=58.23 TRINITY_DN22229_c0_g1_i1:457-1503(-)